MNVEKFCTEISGDLHFFYKIHIFFYTLASVGSWISNYICFVNFKNSNLMKKFIYVLVLSLGVLSMLVLANREINNETKPALKPLSISDKKANLDQRKKWEASPDGIHYKKWEVSAEGKKVQASYHKIMNDLKAFKAMEAVVTSVTFKRKNAKSSGPKWLVVRINKEEYMMQFIPKEFENLKNLKVNDTILIKSRSAGLSPNHPYLILSGDYISQNKKVLFKRDLSKNNRC